jgi:hypothetical protein
LQSKKNHKAYFGVTYAVVNSSFAQLATCYDNVVNPEYDSFNKVYCSVTSQVALKAGEVLHVSDLARNNQSAVQETHIYHWHNESFWGLIYLG